MNRGKNVSLEKRVVSSELQRFLQSRLNCLPLKQREVLELCFFGGLTQREIAAIMATPLRTVKIRLELGLHRIANQVTPFARKCSKMPMNVSREEPAGASWGYGRLGPKIRGAKIRGKKSVRTGTHGELRTWCGATPRRAGFTPRLPRPRVEALTRRGS